MKKDITGKLIIIAIVVILCIPIISDMVGGNLLPSIKFADFDKTLNATNSYGFTLLYVDSSKNDKVKEQKTIVKDYIKKYEKNPGNTKVDAVYLDSKDLSEKQLSKIFGNNGYKSGYAFLVNSEILKVVSSDIKNSELENLISEYSGNKINDELVNYKTPKNASEFKKLISNKKKVTMAVFGRDTCFYCNQFKLVYNTVAKEKDLDIYYVNSDTMDTKEYDKIMNLKLKIPAACSDSAKESTLEKGFATPLTLFIKNGKTIDCIGGYKNKKSLITKLETVGLLK